MTNLRILCLFVLIAAALLSGCKRPANKERLIGPLASNVLIAVVNGSNLYAGPIEEIVQRSMAEYQVATGAELTAEQLSRQRRQLINQLIMETIVRQRIAASDIVVSPEEFYNEYVDTVTNQFGTWEDYEEILAKNNVTTAQFARAVYDQLKLIKLVRKEMGVTDASEEDARQYYAAHSNEFDFAAEAALSHILIKARAEDDAATQSNNIKRLERVRAEILAGLPFAEAAKKYSECRTSSRGGFLGMIQEDNRGVPEFLHNPAFSLPVSNVSGVVESEHGYHLFYVTKRTPAYTARYDQIHAELLQALNQHALQDALRQWLIKAREEADVEEIL